MYKKYIKACCKAGTILAFMLSNSNVIHASIPNHSPAINNAKLSIDNNWNPNAFNNNDLISLIQNYSIILDKQDGVVGSIDLGTSSGSQIFVENSRSVGDIFKNNSSASIPVQLTGNIPLTLTGNDYSGVMNIRLAPNLNNNSGNIIFENTYDVGNFNITFDIGTPALKLNTVGIRQDPVTHYEITTVLKSGHKIYANEFQLAPSDPPNNRMDSILELEDDTIMDAAITTNRLDPNGDIYNYSSSGSGNYISGGSLIVDEGSIITGQIGTQVDPLYNVTFASNNKNKQVILGGSIYSKP